jgi:hypothetical protein
MLDGTLGLGKKKKKSTYWQFKGDTFCYRFYIRYVSFAFGPIHVPLHFHTIMMAPTYLCYNWAIIGKNNSSKVLETIWVEQTNAII